ncbi:hypothetical protein L0F63_003785 [Massospora cicadina]|nr:hypothetical protein L0F63_003785 [Massospora cicadina]
MPEPSTQPLLSNAAYPAYSIPILPSSSDPLQLSDKRKSQDELHTLKVGGKSKAHSFYVKQNELIDSLLTPIGEETDDSEALLKLKLAIYGSVGANVLLFLLQLYAAVKTGSLSLFATMADAFMDLLSSVILMLTAKAAESKTAPIFSSLMSTVSVQLMVEGIKSLLSRRVDLELDYISIGCVVFALGSKMFLYAYCVALSQYPSANILALDHRNDIIVNVFGLSMSVLGHRFAWWIDPVGCLLVALLILRSWVSTAIEHIDLIVGVSADPAFLQRLTYIAFTHDDRIVQVDTCRAYHVGNNVFVEVDIVLNPNTPLHESHDIGESLQNKLEKISEVERAFVHVDYESTHRPEH